MVAASTLSTALSVATPTAAQPSSVGGAVAAHVDARARHHPDPDRFDHRGELTVGVELRGLVTPRSVPAGYAAGIDYQLGAGYPASFVYDANLQPIGLGVLLGELGYVSVLGGVGVSGATGSVPISAQLPVEARLEVDLPGPLHAALWLRPAWLWGERREGTVSFSFADEASAGLALRIGREGRRWAMRHGSGLFIGGLYSERGSSRAYGLVVGHGFDAVRWREP